MAHSIGGHQQLEAVQTWDQVRLDVAGPHTGGDALNLGGDLLDDLGQKGTGASCGVENLNAVNLFLYRDRLALLVGLAGVPIQRDFRGIGEAIGQAELGLQHLVHGTHDKVDHGFGGIPDAARLAF